MNNLCEVLVKLEKKLHLVIDMPRNLEPMLKNVDQDLGITFYDKESEDIVKIAIDPSK